MIRYRLIDYHDVWGNREEGYEVNESYEWGEIELPEDHTNEDLINKLIEVDYLCASADLDTIEIVNLGAGYELQDVLEGYMPICRLDLIEMG